MTEENKQVDIGEITVSPSPPAHVLSEEDEKRNVEETRLDEVRALLSSTIGVESQLLLEIWYTSGFESHF